MLTLHVTSSSGMSISSGGVIGEGTLTTFIENFCTAFEFDSGGDTFGGSLGFNGFVMFSLSHSSFPTSVTSNFPDVVTLPVTGSFDSIGSTGTADVDVVVPGDFLPFTDFGFTEPLSGELSLHLDFTLVDNTRLTGTADGTISIFEVCTDVGASISAQPFNLTAGLGCDEVFPI